MLLRSDDGKEFELGPETLVGREEECQVVLAEEHVSRYHAKITVVNNKVSIEDLNSKNGTYVNGKKLTQIREVGIGDEICFDQMIFRVVTPDSGKAKSTLFRSPSKAQFSAKEDVKPPKVESKSRPDMIGDSSVAGEPQQGKVIDSKPVTTDLDDFDATNNLKVPPQIKKDPRSEMAYDLIDEASMERIASLAEAKETPDQDSPKPSLDDPAKAELELPEPNVSDLSQHKVESPDLAEVEPSPRVEPETPVQQKMESPVQQKVENPVNPVEGLAQPKAKQPEPKRAVKPEDTTQFDVNHLYKRDQLSRATAEGEAQQEGAFLVALSAPLRGHEFVLSDFSANEVIVGRDETCDIVLSDSTVSSRHARFYQVGNRWCVANLGATNGVKVNGEKVDHAWLDQDDVIKLGRMEVQFSLQGTRQRAASEIAESLFAREKAKDKTSKLPWMVGAAFMAAMLIMFAVFFFFGGI